MYGSLLDIDAYQTPFGEASGKYTDGNLWRQSEENVWPDETIKKYLAYCFYNIIYHVL